jgi:hypothetical protein
MTSTIYKRRSINLDDRTYKRGKLLAKSQTVSLSALLRLLINGAYSSSSGVEKVIRNLWGRVEKLVFSIPKKEVEGVEAETTIVH